MKQCDHCLLLSHADLLQCRQVYSCTSPSAPTRQGAYREGVEGQRPNAQLAQFRAVLQTKLPLVGAVGAHVEEAGVTDVDGGELWQVAQANTTGVGKAAMLEGEVGERLERGEVDVGKMLRCAALSPKVSEETVWLITTGS